MLYTAPFAIEVKWRGYCAGVALVPKLEEKLKPLVTGFCTLEEAPRVMTELGKGSRTAIKIIIRF